MFSLPEELNFNVYTSILCSHLGRQKWVAEYFVINLIWTILRSETIPEQEINWWTRWFSACSNDCTKAVFFFIKFVCHKFVCPNLTIFLSFARFLPKLSELRSKLLFAVDRVPFYIAFPSFSLWKHLTSPSFTQYFTAGILVDSAFGISVLLLLMYPGRMRYYR